MDPITWVTSYMNSALNFSILFVSYLCLAGTLLLPLVFYLAAKGESHWCSKNLREDLAGCLWGEYTSLSLKLNALSRQWTMLKWVMKVFKISSVVSQSPDLFLFFTTVNFAFPQVSYWSAVADLRGTPAPPNWGTNSFNFMQFLGKFGKIVCWRPPPPESWCPHHGEILDPPL